MKLAAVSIAPLAARLEEPVANSRAQWSRREGALVQLLSDAGAMGQGEASPLPHYSPDSLAECHAALSSYPWHEVDAFLEAPDPSRSKRFPLLLPPTPPSLEHLPLEPQILQKPLGS